MTAGLLVFAAPSLMAQRDTLPTSRARDRAAMVVGFADSQRRDGVVSPVTFAGVGYGASVDYDHSGPRGLVAVSATWDAQRFRPQTGVVSATEQVAEATLRADLLRRVGDSRDWIDGVGASVSAWGIGATHRYADPGASRAQFVAVFATLGPAVAAARSLAGGSAHLQLSAPLFGLVDRTYSVARSDFSPVQIRLVGPRELGALSGAASYVAWERSAVSMICAYRFQVLSYRDAQPLHTASQTLSVGLSRRLGGTAR